MGSPLLANRPHPEQPNATPVVPKAMLYIEGGKTLAEGISLKALWQYREMLYFFTLRDLKLRYKQTVLGAAWTLLQPLLTSGVFTLLFSKVARLPSDGVPYPLFCIVALLPWNFFANSLVRSATSLVGNGHLIGKVYFPRYLIPFAALLPGLVDFLIAQAVLIPLMLVYHFAPPLTCLLFMPLLGLMVFVFSLGMGLWLSAINVRFRDIGNILPFLMQLWMFATPIIYPASMVPAQYRWIMALNPMTGAINGFRSAFLGSPWDFSGLAISVGFTLLIFVSGSQFFRRVERYFADSV